MKIAKIILNVVPLFCDVIMCRVQQQEQEQQQQEQEQQQLQPYKNGNLFSVDGQEALLIRGLLLWTINISKSCLLQRILQIFVGF